MGKKYLITDTITPTLMDIDFNSSTIVFFTTDKTKPVFISQGQANKTWRDGYILGTSYMPLAGIQFKSPDNQAMTLDNIKVRTCRHGVYGDEGENINRIIFSNCDFGSNLIAGFWMKSYETTYAHSAPVFFNNTILNANGVPSWLTTQTFEGVQVKEDSLKWGVQFYYKGVSTLVWNGGQISDHNSNNCLAHVLVTQANGVTFSDFDFEDMSSPVTLDGTPITDTATNETVYASTEGGAMTFSACSDVSVKFNHVNSINQQSLIKIEYTCRNVVLSLPSDTKLIGSMYSVNAFGQGGSNTSTIKILTPTNKINGKTLNNISNTSLIKILESGNKDGVPYAPVGGVGVHFDTNYADTEYRLPYIASGDLASTVSNNIKIPVYGITSLGIKAYIKELGYSVTGSLIVSFYDSSDVFISASDYLNLRPTVNTFNSHGLNSIVVSVPISAKFARIGLVNSANYTGLIPSHGALISFSVFALGDTEFNTSPICRSMIL